MSIKAKAAALAQKIKDVPYYMRGSWQIMRHAPLRVNRRWAKFAGKTQCTVLA